MQSNSAVSKSNGASCGLGLIFAEIYGVINFIEIFPRRRFGAVGEIAQHVIGHRLPYAH